MRLVFTFIGLSLLSSAIFLGVEASSYRVFPADNSSSSAGPCIDADFEGATFSLPYPCHRPPETVCTAVVSLPAPTNCSRIGGVCGNRTAELEVAWSGGRMRLRLSFRERVFDNVWTQVTPRTVTYSFVSDLHLLADLRDPVFANASIGKHESPMVEYWLPKAKRSLLLFAAPVHSAFVCSSPEEVPLNWRRLRGHDDGKDKKAAAAAAAAEGALLHFPTVRLMTSLSKPDGRKAHDGDFLCEADSKRHRTGIVALAIAGVIGVCMIVIVAGYLTTRLSKGTRYSNMD